MSVDLDALLARLEHAAFTQREQIAEEVAPALTPAQLGALQAWLDDPRAAVRLGAIELVRRAGHRDALARLVRHARERGGDDRVFALRALAQLARPGDPVPAEALRGWLAAGDPFVELQAKALERALAPAEETIAALVKKLHGAATGGERMALVAAIERRGPDALVAATRVLAAKSNGDVVALMCRALLRHGVPEAGSLLPALEAARARLDGWPVACAAIDDLLLAAGDRDATAALLVRAGKLDATQLADLAARLLARPAEELVAHAPALIAAAAQRPALWLVLAHLAEAGDREALRAACDAPLTELRRGQPLDPAVILAVARVFTATCLPGEPLPRALRVALERQGERGDLAKLCMRLGTEEAARIFIALPGAPRGEWSSPWVMLEGGTLVTRYHDEGGRPLVRRDDKLLDADGVEHVLDDRGQPRRAADSEHGGCLCCAPPRALVRRRGEGLVCPGSGSEHLRDAGRTLLARDAPHGRCRRCDSIRPRVREGLAVVCRDCGAGREATVPSEPTPPRAEELAELAPHIRAAMSAHVLLHARVDSELWSGAGIIVAREDDRVAILTCRHLVESQEDERLAVIRALTVAGELVLTTTVWRAGRGVDLALLEARVAQPDALGVIPLAGGAATAGAPAFAAAWSYSAGTVSAIRRFATGFELPVTILQTDVSAASGGGLFDADGHLIGLVSSGRAGAVLATTSIREALLREKVRWRGRPLIAETVR